MSDKERWELAETTFGRLFAEQGRRLSVAREDGRRGRVTDAEKALELLYLACTALKCVRKHWLIDQPGSYCPCFFLHDAEGRVVADELVLAEDREVMRACPYPVVPLSRILRSACPRCHMPGLPAIEMTERGKSRWLVPCTACGAQDIAAPGRP